MRLPGIIFLGLSLPNSPVFANEYTFSLGTEYFSWREYDHTGAKLLEETGPRGFAALDTVSSFESGRAIGFHGRLYNAQVYYDGQYQDGTPVSTDVNYQGAAVELSLAQPLHYGTEARWAVQTGLGIDYWTRDLLGPGGYMETYTASFLRVGGQYSRETFSIAVGTRLPFSVTEEVGLRNLSFRCVDPETGQSHICTYVQNPELSPAATYSLYATLALLIDERWSLRAYYDSFRFNVSPAARVAIFRDDGAYRYSEVWQPESHQDTLGMVLGYRF